MVRGIPPQRPQTGRSLSLPQINALVVVGSVLLCALLQPQRLPGMVLLGTAPNWFLIWVVTWSVKRLPWQGLVAGIALGLIQDGLTAAQPTHVWGLAIAGLLASALDTQRFVEEDFVSVLLIVFFMALLVEGLFAGQLALRGEWIAADLWSHGTRVALSSAIMSSLWTPLLYIPLNRWWDRLHLLLDR